MFGPNKQDEYKTTIHRLRVMYSLSKEDVMFLLYFLSDCQYERADLKAMAELIHNEKKELMK